MKKIKKLGSVVLVALFSLSCTTIIKTMEEKKSHLLAIYGIKKNEPILTIWNVYGDGKKHEKVWDIKVKVKRGGIRSLVFSPNGKYLVAKDGYGNIYVCDISGDRTKVPLLKPLGTPAFDSFLREGILLPIVFSPDSELFASLGMNGDITIFGFEGGQFNELVEKKIKSGQKKVKPWEGLGRPLIAFTPEGNHLISILRGKSTIINRWSVTGKGKKQSIKLNLPEKFYVELLSPDGKYLVLDFATYTKAIWDIEEDMLLKDFEVVEADEIIFSPNSRYFVVIKSKDEAFFNQVVSIFDVSQYKSPIKTFEISTGGPKFEVALSSNGMFAFHESRNSRFLVQIVDATGKSVGNIEHKMDSVALLAFEFGPEPEKPFFHLEDPGLQEKKIELMKEQLGL